MKIEFSNYSGNLMDVADQSVGLKLFASSVARRRLKLLMSSLAWLLSLLDQWSKDKIRPWLKLSYGEGKNEQCLWSHTVTSTSRSCRGTKLVILGNSVNISEILFPHLWNHTYLTQKWEDRKIMQSKFCFLFLSATEIYYITSKEKGTVLWYFCLEMQNWNLSQCWK